MVTYASKLVLWIMLGSMAVLGGVAVYLTELSDRAKENAAAEAGLDCQHHGSPGEKHALCKRVACWKKRDTRFL
ncbi:hypothetical protein F5Y19DRAFT_482301 [Xylariaceae sp. FL1651]|nr:hypothetical protein F5Y19DRAFT_482301 [Xylariaceae sp. FL1651]